MADDPAATAAAAAAAASSSSKKRGRFAQNIAALTERTRLARQEIEKMVDVTAQLKEQCAIQEKESAALEAEHLDARAELDALRERIDTLSEDKAKIEQRLQELRAESAKLDAFARQQESAR
ncbi:hypothetical protein DFJ73DRAFT_799261 [Zopfochytrium polystomum]|nr:hypothetical protein DFJ73DRAFT_799261 [Zopfochytrium polystomum]